MAIGNLFGSNMFNIFALGLTDLFFTQGRFLAVIDPSFLLVGMTGFIDDWNGIDREFGKAGKANIYF